MGPLKNSVSKGFLKKHRMGTGDRFVFLPLSIGFLRLKYLNEKKPFFLSRVDFVSDSSEFFSSIGPALELSLGESADGEATFIEDEAPSGTQWKNGRAFWGHTFDEESDATERRSIDLDAWVDECIEAMINPKADVLAELKEKINFNELFPLVKAGDEKARDKFWKRLCPQTEEEVRVVLDLLEGALKQDEGDLIFICVAPLKRARTGANLILERLTSFLERKEFSDLNSSGLQEALWAHALSADQAIIDRWVALCEGKYKEKQWNVLHRIEMGWLIDALLKSPAARKKAASFFKKVISVTEKSPDALKGVGDLLTYRSMKDWASHC